MRTKKVTKAAPNAHPASTEAGCATWAEHRKIRASHGVLAHLIPSSVSAAHAVAGLAGLICRAKQPSCSPFTSPSPTTILFSGSVERCHLYSQILHAVSRPDGDDALTIKHVHIDARLDWLRGEPRARLEDLVRSPKMSATLLLPVTSEVLQTAALEDIAGLRDLALAHGKLIVFVTRASSIDEFGPVASIVDDCILSEPCEPDPRYDLAWTIEFSAAKAFHADGRGKLMVQVATKPEGYRLAYSRFVSRVRDDRAIWAAIAKGNDRSPVANAMKMSLDEIDQRLIKLRPLRPPHAPKDLVTCYAGLFDFTGLKR
ncbi:hypothetical protein M2282_000637 [Variovorax boronicumulans]|uniref:hypothetical protein n=1 Tax=Variovorax boronicumulans TaxID=436515 RepID=UPI002475E42B|nr:hypothetical protein [Variovorax boronicumulans]MDH6165509.1 hypothetical protein [Variovorax boronicumulans]